ncbi:hypothetical protein JG687_00002649 [Phytophthora cactorum]|uniref:Protein kinase-like domain n=1 Tax=Phytophthora cactorum TaxID=29920 RepID=A0A8T1UTV9_9STRA|nr:hypothetical protein JG687_00002649 [Phytophthora cactorum]
MGGMLPLALLLLLITNIWSATTGTTYAIDTFYTDLDSCSDTPNAIRAYTPDKCTAGTTCFTDGNNDNGTTACKSDYLETMKESFGISQYIIQVIYKDSSCSTFYYAVGYRVTGACELGYVAGESGYEGLFYFIATLPEEGTAKLEFFTTSDCSAITDSSSTTDLGAVVAPKATLESGECVPLDFNSYMYSTTGYTQWYSSNSYDDGGLNTGAIIGIVCGCVVFLLMLVAGIFYYYYRRRSKGKQGGQWTATLPSGDLTSLESAMSGQTGLWNDDVITAKRIPRDKVKTKQRSLYTTGRTMADATLLQKITAGEVRVEFSESSPQSLVELGYACVAVDPADRPTAAEALYRIQIIISQELAE